MQKLSNTDKERIVSTYLANKAGRDKLAESMQGPLRLHRDHAAKGRLAYKVDQLTRGSLPVYDKDADIIAYVVGEEGSSIETVGKSRRVTFPLFELACAPMVPISQVNERRYDIVERILEQAKVAIQMAEDLRVFSVMNACATFGFDSVGPVNPTIQCAGPLNQDVLADAWGTIEAHNLAVSKVFMNPIDLTDFRKQGRDFFSPDHQKTILDNGYISDLWGASLISSTLCPRGKVFVCTEPEYFGRIPVRAELTVLAADNAVERLIGFSAFEHLGIGNFNPFGQVMIQVRR